MAATFTAEAGSSTTTVARLTGLTLAHCLLEGPVLSGPRQTPFICQTAAFTLLDGSKCGTATDATTAAAPTVVQCV